jgi:hypothetical protein
VAVLLVAGHGDGVASPFLPLAPNFADRFVVSAPGAVLAPDLANTG